MAPEIGRSRLPEILESKNWKQVDLARKLGLSEGYISQVIAGKRYFSYPVAVKAAWLLDCKMEDLHYINYP